MAHAIANVLSQIVTNAEPAAGAHETSAEVDTGAKLARGAWVHVELGASAYASAPGGYDGYAPSIVVTLYPRHASSGEDHSDEPIWQEVIDLADITIASAFRASVYFDGVLPQFSVIDVQNRTDTAVATNKLNAWLDYVIESTT